jgi:type IV pilus assembly protein PilY1
MESLMKSEWTSTESRKPRRFDMVRRAIALLMCELLVLQPAMAQLSQVPMFTVSSAPPNVMLVLDDSGSMNQVLLSPPPGMGSPTFSLGTLPSSPALKINTVGYYGVKGSAFDMGGNSAYDGRWRLALADVIMRSAAFNPLAYNPSTQYRPWNNNGARMDNASYGGATNVASAARTEWDMRTLPASMGGGAVKDKLVGTNSGWITNASMPRSLSSTPPGTVRYTQLHRGNTPEPPLGADLFTGTITFKNPDCGTSTTTPNYAWQCNTGTLITPSPAETCNAANLNQFSVNGRQCCTATSTTSTSAWVNSNRDQWFTNPPGSPPAMTGPSGEVCLSIAHTGATQTITGLPPCTTVDDPPYVAPCPGNGAELCIIDPPPVTTCTGTQTNYQWRCNYDRWVTTTTTVCTSTALQKCRSPSSTTTCSGAPLDPTSNAQYDAGYWTPARYVTYDGPQPGTPAQRLNLSNYRLIMIDRKFGWNVGTGSRDLITDVSKYPVVDSVTGLPSYRRDCDAPPTGTGIAGQDGTWCTFEQEAQNYANWFTYYRSRLFAAVGVMSEVLAGFTGPEQYMRLGFGRINYFKGALNPWNVNSVTDIPHPATLPNLDGQPNEGAVVRGVRPFTVNEPPLSATLNPKRQEIFDLLFSVNGLGPTPNRETMHAVGQYFKRADSSGPWGMNPGSGGEPASEHLWCRRNFTVLATDGEWTKVGPVGAFEPQRLLERASDWNVDPIGAGVTSSMSTTGPLITGTERDTGASLAFTFDPANEPQLGSSAQTGTLTDVMHYYWSRDLRPDLRNSILTTPTNRAFWQHMASYVVGYGVNASFDSPTLRPQFHALQTVAWPTVGLETCRQLDNNAQDAALGPPACTPAQHTVSPSGNRINDTLRASLAGAGDFFSAQSPSQLYDSLKAVFEAINAETGAGSAPAFSSPSVAAGGLLVQTTFKTDLWEGYMKAYDTKAFLDFLAGGPAAPEVWSLNLPAHGSRNIVTATDQATAVTFQWCNLTATQRTTVDPIASAGPCGNGSPIFDYLRGDQSLEQRFGGIFRTRRDTVVGDIVNSQPLYSKAADYSYRFQAAAAHASAPPHPYSSYPTYVNNKKANRHPVVMFGANDGMFHVVDARVGEPTSGREIFAYVPRSVYPQLRNLSDPAYSHRYFVDGPIVEGDIWDGTNWKTIVVGSTGAGPAGLFALDMSKPQDGLGAANVLWDIVPADHASAEVQEHLGNVMGLGVIGSVKYDADSNPLTLPNGKWVFITGNGYQSANHQATLLVFDVMTGALIRSIQTGVGSVANRNGMGAIAPVYDGARNIVGVYAGDRLGNLWKFDLSSSDPANWKIANEQPLGMPKPLFQAGATRPIHQEPRVLPHPLGGLYVAFGTGRLHEVGDIGDTNDQGIFVVWDKGQKAPVPFGDLELLQLEEYTVGPDTMRQVRAADLANYDWNDKGFWIRLQKFGSPPNGERIIAPMILDLGTLSVTSFTPESGTDLCVPGGTSYLYRIDLTGKFALKGTQVHPGTAGAMMPFHEPIDYGSSVVETMNAAEVKSMLATPKYRLSGGAATNLSGFGACTNVGLKVDGTFARIPSECAGMLPMRTWRPVR